MDNHDSFPCGQDDGRLSIVSSTPTSTLTICETNLCKFQDKPVATTSSSSNACYPSWRIRLSVPKSLTLQQLTSKGPIGRFLIQRRLGRIAFRVYRDQKRLEQKDLWDLLELLLEKVYPDNIRNKVWRLLLESYQGCPSQFAQAFLSSPQHHLLKFLTAISQSNLTCASKFSEICDLVVAIQQGNPHSLQDLLTLDSFCIITTPELRALPFNPLSCWLIKFADNEAKRADHSGMAQWTPSARATCLLDFIATGDRAAKHIRTIIDQTCTLIRWFSDTESFVSDISQVFACAPSLAISHTIHPALPFFQMAFHLACLSPEACEVFVEMDILQLISRTWLRSFPDPRNCPAHRQFQMQNDMRVVCLLMIGAISRHFPSSEEVANHLLHIHAESEDQGCPISDMNSSAETIAGNCIQLPVFPPESCVVTSSIFLGIPPLSLFVIEACVKNGIYIPCSANSSSISPWAQVLDVFSAHKPSVSTQNVAARITLLCASDGEDYWRPLLETIYKFPYGKLSAAFQYILYEYLRLNEEDPCLPKETNSALRRMAMTSQTRGHTVANPIDRFILMMHQVAQSGPALLAMRHVGVYYLLEAVVRGRYDAYNRDMEDPTGIQDKLRLNPVVRMHTALKDHDRAMQKGESKLLCEETPIRRCSITLSNTEDYLL